MAIPTHRAPGTDVPANPPKTHAKRCQSATNDEYLMTAFVQLNTHG